MHTRIATSLIFYVLWIVVTLLGAKLLLGGKEAPLEESVKDGIGWQFVAAIALLAAFILARKWNDLAFAKPHSVARVMWFPVVWLLLITMMTLLVGLPPARMLAFIAFNTLLVGISEETMFRGVLFRALLTRYRIWTAIIVSSVLFGAVHILNVFNTGNLGSALMQSVPAGMSGILFVAIVIRTGSIWPAIVYHWLLGLRAVRHSDRQPSQRHRSGSGRARRFGRRQGLAARRHGTAQLHLRLDPVATRPRRELSRGGNGADGTAHLAIELKLDRFFRPFCTIV